MRVARLESEIDFEGWRGAARVLRAEGVKPEAVVWTVERDLFDFSSPALAGEVAAKPMEGASTAADAPSVTSLRDVPPCLLRCC